MFTALRVCVLVFLRVHIFACLRICECVGGCVLAYVYRREGVGSVLGYLRTRNRLHVYVRVHMHMHVHERVRVRMCLLLLTSPIMSYCMCLQRGACICLRRVLYAVIAYYVLCIMYYVRCMIYNV